MQGERVNEKKRMAHMYLTDGHVSPLHFQLPREGSILHIIHLFINVLRLIKFPYVHVHVCIPCVFAFLANLTGSGLQ